MEGPMSKKTNEPPKRRANHKRNIEFSNPFLSQEAYQIKKGEELLSLYIGVMNFGRTIGDKTDVLLGTSWGNNLRTW
jgi:hypothetical protein